MDNANVNAHLTVTDTRADVLKDLCGISAETIVVLTVGKLITKRQFPPVVVIPFPIVRFCVCLATKRPVLTVAADF